MKTGLKVWQDTVAEIKDSGLWKDERVITTQQSSKIDTTVTTNVINMCANNYLGLANNKELAEVAKKSLDKWGYGLSSVRFICGTQEVHKQLEAKISQFLGFDDAILYSSCFDANGGLFETLLSEQDVVISDELNHASIIDGVRLCKANRARYKNNDMADLEAQLKAHADKRIRLIVTDGVFSMDGIIANLKAICDLADKYDAIVAVDESHATGVIGKTGRGSIEYCDVIGRIDIVTGTLGKALGGASGGFTAARKEIVDILRQRSRPYLFSNTLAPTIASATIRVFEMLMESTALVDKLQDNVKYYVEKLREAGFEIVDGRHPIIPIMVYDELIAQKMAAMLLDKGIYAVGFFYPVVPKGKARIRTQISAAHTHEQLDYVVNALIECKKELGL
ncbi:MAG: glycine C-acetyltransferase [Clostridiales bacterium]|nr:glycine C-acetyltransferase [Clostridiales bacterium]